MKDAITPFWNPFREGYLEDPSAQLRILRDHNPVHKGISGRWVLFKYEDVKYILLNPAFKTIKLHEHISSKNQFLNYPEDLSCLSTAASRWLFFMNPPEHPALRQLIVKLWNRYDIQDYIEKVVNEAIEKNASKSDVEIVSDFAVIIPIRIICKILGLPIENYRQLREWAYNFARTVELFESLNKLLLYNKSAQEFYDFMEKIVEDKKNNPDDSFISNFLIANQSLESPLDREESISVFIILFFAGIETSIYLIGQSVLHLIQNPGQTQMLRDNLSLAPQAVEELIRFSSPTQYTPRTVTHEIEIRGKTIKSGEIIMGCVASANRDPEIFQNPEDLDFTRKPSPHLSFGHGLHRCIGAKLARDEMNVLVPGFLNRFSKIKFNGVNPFQWHTSIINRGLRQLHVVLTQ